jgi:hypothetical protein
MKSTQKKSIGRMVTTIAAVGLVAMMPLVGTGCENTVTETKWVERENQSKIRLLDGWVTVKCRNDLLDDSLDVLNRAMIILEGECASDPSGLGQEFADALLKGNIVIVVKSGGANYSRDNKEISVAHDWLVEAANYSVVEATIRGAISTIGTDSSVL